MLHDWCNKGCGMCYPVCGMVHIKEPLLLIEKSPCGDSGFPLSHYLCGTLPYVWHHIIVNKMCLNASLNKTFPSFPIITSYVMLLYCCQSCLINFVFLFVFLGLYTHKGWGVEHLSAVQSVPRTSHQVEKGLPHCGQIWISSKEKLRQKGW